MVASASAIHELSDELLDEHAQRLVREYLFTGDTASAALYIYGYIKNGVRLRTISPGTALAALHRLDLTRKDLDETRQRPLRWR